MAKISAGIRAKRFKVKENSKIELILENEMGEKVNLRVVDGSLSGVGSYTDNIEIQNKLSGLKLGTLFPESKLVWDQNEVSLGRLALRSAVKNPEHGDRLKFGLSCVDNKVPLLGDLSKHFETHPGADENPLDYELNSKKYNLASFLEADHSNADILHKCKEYTLLQKDQAKNPLFQYYAIRHDVEGPRVNLALPTIRKPTQYVNFGSYDYFSFSSDPEIKEAAIKAIEKFGVSSTATPPLSGRTSLHEELEFKLSQMLRKEATYLFSSGFAANVGALTGVLSASDLAVADILSHASIHDGLAASRSKVRFFRHNDNAHFESLLVEHRNSKAGALTITEGLFSMDGDVPDLKTFVDTSIRNGARVFLDEVHSFGVMGPTGLGAAERCGVLDQIDIYTGSLSKGVGAIGGFVSGSQELINWLKGFARAGIFSSAIPPAGVAGTLKAIEILRRDNKRRSKLHQNIKQLHEGLKELGYTPISDLESPIVPIIIGDETKLGVINRVLLEFGVFVNPIIFPAVAPTACRLRFSVTHSHSFSDVQLALMALKKGLSEAKVDFRAQALNKKTG